MKTTKQMARVITRIAQQAGLDLDKVGAHVRIDNPPFMPLSIEVVGKNLVSVTHYYEQNGDLIPDPDMVFYTNVLEGYGWVPVHFQANTGYFQQASWVEDGEITRFDMRTRPQTQPSLRVAQTAARIAQCCQPASCRIPNVGEFMNNRSLSLA